MPGFHLRVIVGERIPTGKEAEEMTAGSDITVLPNKLAFKREVTFLPYSCRIK